MKIPSKPGSQNGLELKKSSATGIQSPQHVTSFDDGSKEIKSEKALPKANPLKIKKCNFC
ncbi:MAG: hypothetical protein IPH68_15195 [Chitinophagaceae bacterium]|nr:hypothetical protein [Chitinophagaceae bacterium]